MSEGPSVAEPSSCPTPQVLCQWCWTTWLPSPWLSPRPRLLCSTEAGILSWEFWEVRWAPARREALQPSRMHLSSVSSLARQGQLGCCTDYLPSALKLLSRSWKALVLPYPSWVLLCPRWPEQGPSLFPGAQLCHGTELQCLLPLLSCFLGPLALGMGGRGHSDIS